MNRNDPPQEGDVWRYPYLWRWQDARNETEGRKNRPVSFVAVAKTVSGEHLLFVLPITSKEPDTGAHAIEIPQTELRRAGLDSALRLWIVIDEYNLDILERSFYFEPGERLGSFSPKFRSTIVRQFRQLFSVRRSKPVKRFE